MVYFEMVASLGGIVYFIGSAYVLPEYRGRGIFRNLYKSIKERADKDPLAKEIRLIVDKNNASAQKTYSNLGMKNSNLEFCEKDFIL